MGSLRPCRADLARMAAGKKGTMAKLVKLALGWFGLSFLSASVFSISSAQHLEFFSERVWISLCLSCMAYCI